MGGNSFGYVEVDGDYVKAFVGRPKNPTVHRFENAEIVNAVNLLNELKRRIEADKEKTEDHVMKCKEWLEDNKDILDKIMPDWIFSGIPSGTISLNEIEDLIKIGEQKLLDAYNK